jgi:hypothetical protein
MAPVTRPRYLRFGRWLNGTKLAYGLPSWFKGLSRFLFIAAPAQFTSDKADEARALRVCPSVAAGR